MSLQHAVALFACRVPPALLCCSQVSLANPTQEKRAIIFNIPQTPFAAANAGFFIQTVVSKLKRPAATLRAARGCS